MFNLSVITLTILIFASIEMAVDYCTANKRMSKRMSKRRERMDEHSNGKSQWNQ